MDYLASIRKKERENLRHILKETNKELCEGVQDERNENNEISPWLGDVEEGIQRSSIVARATPPKGSLQLSDVVIEPAAMNATPIFWERLSTGDILGPAQPEFLAMVSSGLKASYWIVAQFEGLPLWINSILLRSKRQFEEQARLPGPAAPSIAKAPRSKSAPDAIKQSSLEFPDGS